MNKENTNPCPICRNQELQQLRRDLSECRKRNQSKDKKIQRLDKRVFILTLVAISVGVVLGKETLDAIVDWLETPNGIRNGVDELIFPAPSTLALFAFAFVPGRRRRRKS